VRSVLEAAGFNYTDSHDWNMLWVNSSPKSYLYQGLNENQRINHFPMSTSLTHKDKMCKNLMFMQERFGRQHYNISPDTYVLPDEFSDFYSHFHREKAIWISKPNASSQGKGIYLVDNINEVSVDNECII